MTETEQPPRTRGVRGRIRAVGHGYRGFQQRARRTRTGALMLRLGVTLVGTAVILAGIVMLVGPGQGVLAIILGLAILATEFAWAERWMHSLKQRVERAAQHAREMDPKVRRRRILLTVLACLLVVGLLVGAVALWGWPVLALDSWDQMQQWIGWLPELPGTPPGHS